MTLIGATTALALAGTLSYMSLMPERFMALNSMGIGFSGLISLLLSSVLLLIFGSHENGDSFVCVITFYALCCLIMMASASMYFFERKSAFAQFYISLSTTKIDTKSTSNETPKAKCAITALWTNSRFAFMLAWPMLF